MRSRFVRAALAVAACVGRPHVFFRGRTTTPADNAAENTLGYTAALRSRPRAVVGAARVRRNSASAPVGIRSVAIPRAAPRSTEITFSARYGRKRKRAYLRRKRFDRVSRDVRPASECADVTVVDPYDTAVGSQKTDGRRRYRSLLNSPNPRRFVESQRLIENRVKRRPVRCK